MGGQVVAESGEPNKVPKFCFVFLGFFSMLCRGTIFGTLYRVGWLGGKGEVTV